MSSYAQIIRTGACLAFCAATFATDCRGADPKVIKASHTQTARIETAEPAAAKAEDLSYSPQWPEPPNTTAMLTRLGFGTFAVLGLCVATLWLGKPWLQRFQIKTTAHPDFFIEATLTTGNRATLYLIRVGQTQLVAGTDALGLKSLIALPPTFKDVLDQQVQETETEPATPSMRDRTPERPAATAATIEAALPRPFSGQTMFRSGAKD